MARAYAKRISDVELHAAVNEAIQKTGLTTGKQWSGAHRSEPVVGPRGLDTLYTLVRLRVKRGRNFYGHGSWERYLEKEHGVAPIYGKSWSNERVHWTIATLLKQHPPEKTGWSQQVEVTQGVKSLGRLFRQAYHSNKREGEAKRKFFGHNTWENYVAWLRRNYSDSEKRWRR